jgi:hypothetical protein
VPYSDVDVCGVFAGNGGESKCPVINFPGMPVDSYRVDYLVEKSGVASTVIKTLKQGRCL